MTRVNLFIICTTPDFVKPEVKAAVAQQHTQQEAAAETKADGKPQTKKRANRKGK